MKNFLRLSVLLAACPLICPGIAVSAQNFGSVKVGDSTTATITVTIASAGTVDSISVRLLGTENLDFTNAGGGTCAVGTAYAAKATCTVKVTFAPSYPGWRQGAVVLFSGAGGKGTVLGNVPVYGVGTGPQLAFGTGVATAIDPKVNGAALKGPRDMAFDGAGDMFISDCGNNRVVELPVGGGTATVIAPVVNGHALTCPGALAIDGAGDLYIADGSLSDARVVEVPAGGGTPIAFAPTVDGTALYFASGVAVDSAGDLFITDGGYPGLVYEVPADGGAATAIEPTVDGISLTQPYGMAFDVAGDLFIADQDNYRLVEIPAGGGKPIAVAPVVNNYDGFGQPGFLAFDGAGDLFISDIYWGDIVEVPAGGGAAIVITPTVNGLGIDNTFGIAGIALDAGGDLFIADAWNNRLVEVGYAQAPAISFASTTVDLTSSDSPKTVQVENIGNLPLIFSAIGYPADFPKASGDSSACAASASLSAGQQCDLPVDFSPRSAGSLIESVTLTDNTLNLAGSMQEIAVSGVSLGPQTITFNALPNVVYPVAPITLTATASSGLAVGYTVTGPANVSGSTLTIFGTGSVAVTASQPGNTMYAAASPVIQTFTVLLPSTVSIRSSVPTQTLGWPAVFTAKVSGTGTIPTGTVTFFSGSTSLGSGVLAGGVATLSTSSLTLGSDAITVRYSGDANYAAATSSPIAVVVTSTPALALTESPNPAGAYAPITLTATVENPTGSAVPTGTVLFYLDDKHLGLATLAGGVATWQISGLAPGLHSVGAQFNGDKNYKGVPSVSLWEVVDKAPATVTLTASPNPVVHGAPLTITAAIAKTLTGKIPTGTVRFFNLHTLIGQQTLSGGQASITVSNLPAGDNQIVVQYTGDANYTSGDSNFLYEIVQTPAPGPSTTVNATNPNSH